LQVNSWNDDVGKAVIIYELGYNDTDCSEQGLSRKQINTST